MIFKSILFIFKLMLELMFIFVFVNVNKGMMKYLLMGVRKCFNFFKGFCKVFVFFLIECKIFCCFLVKSVFEFVFVYCLFNFKSFIFLEFLGIFIGIIKVRIIVVIVVWILF